MMMDLISLSQIRCSLELLLTHSWLSFFVTIASIFTLLLKNIGQTQRNLSNRIEEHRTSLSSSVCRHVQANPDHRVDFHNPEVIGSDNNGRRLQILESLLIQENKPELNANIPSIPLCIFNQGCNEEGARGAQFPGRRMTAGGRRKVPTISQVLSTFFNTIHLLPKDDPGLLLAPGVI